MGPPLADSSRRNLTSHTATFRACVCTAMCRGSPSVRTVWFFLSLCAWTVASPPGLTHEAVRLRLQNLLQRLGSSTPRTPHEHTNSSEDHPSWPYFPDTGTTPPPVTTPVPSQLHSRPDAKSYQEFYKVFYGTSEEVNYLKRNYGPTGLKRARADFGITQELNDVRQANEHFLRIRTRARCRLPRSKVIRVKDYYPDPSKEYLPRCTVLHRCGEDSGCCDNDGFECVPRAVQEVTLHFYTLQVGRHAGASGLSNRVERLLFINHTECECQPINDLPRIQEEPRQHHSVHMSPAHTVDFRPSKCRECPVPFSRREFPDGRCSCDCFDRQRPCLRIKRGREPLSEIERRCVEVAYCHVPDCEYGYFDASTGRCPKKPDDGHRGGDRSAHNNHRWSFLERD